MSGIKHFANLLLIDDDSNIVRLLSTIIERSFEGQIKIETFIDSEKARTRIEDGGVDILLTDLEMPNINGMELLRCAKRRNACTQVLFLTGQSTHSSLLDALELGATDYLLKPINQEQLLMLITEAYNRQQRWQQALSDIWRQRRELVETE